MTGSSGHLVTGCGEYGCSGAKLWTSHSLALSSLTATAGEGGARACCFSPTLQSHPHPWLVFLVALSFPLRNDGQFRFPNISMLNELEIGNIGLPLASRHWQSDRGSTSPSADHLQPSCEVSAVTGQDSPQLSTVSI